MRASIVGAVECRKRIVGEVLAGREVGRHSLRLRAAAALSEADDPVAEGAVPGTDGLPVVGLIAPPDLTMWTVLPSLIL